MTCGKIPFSDNVYPYWQTVPAGGIHAGSGTSVRIVLSLVGPIINAPVIQTIQLSTRNPGTRPKSRWLPDNSKASVDTCNGSDLKIKCADAQTQSLQAF